MPRLHVLVSERELDRPGGEESVEEVLERAAPCAVHLRARIDDRRGCEIARRFGKVAQGVGGWVVVNGRPDIALAAGAQAVQLGRGALGVEDTRTFLAACAGRLAIGVSVHGAEGALSAIRAGADYLVLGTIYRTPSHPRRAGDGPRAISRVQTRLSGVGRAPILAIGGITVETVEEVVAAGAHGIVVGRAVWAAPDPVEAASRLDRALGASCRTASGGPP